MRLGGGGGGEEVPPNPWQGVPTVTADERLKQDGVWESERKEQRAGGTTLNNDIWISSFKNFEWVLMTEHQREITKRGH